MGVDVKGPGFSWGKLADMALAHPKPIAIVIVIVLLMVAATAAGKMVAEVVSKLAIPIGIVVIVLLFIGYGMVSK